MASIDWGAAKGIADEATFDRFVRSVGGAKISDLIPNPDFENADYFFTKENIIIELKILETEFADASQFKNLRLVCL